MTATKPIEVFWLEAASKLALSLLLVVAAVELYAVVPGIQDRPFAYVFAALVLFVAGTWAMKELSQRMSERLFRGRPELPRQSSLGRATSAFLTRKPGPR